jgi:hypothetical protein
MHDGDDSHDSRAGSDDEEYEDGGGEEEEDEEHDSGGDEQHGASAAAAVAVGAASSSGPARSRSGSRSNSAKKKRRITQACDPCRRRKRKCDGAQPVCSACTRLKLVCGYQAAVKKRGPPAGIVKRLRQSVQALESELSHEQMQARLAKLASSGIAAPHAKQQMTEQHQAQSLHPSSSPRATNAHDVVAAAAAGAASDDDAAAADGLLDGSALTLSAAANSSVRNRTYLQTYFTLLNNTSVHFQPRRSGSTTCGTLSCVTITLICMRFPLSYVFHYFSFVQHASIVGRVQLLRRAGALRIRSFLAGAPELEPSFRRCAQHGRTHVRGHGIRRVCRACRTSCCCTIVRPA